MLIGIIDIKNDALRRFARREECLSADRAAVRAKDVANVDELCDAT